MAEVCIISRDGKRACILTLSVIKRAGEYWADCGNTQYRVHECDCPCYDYLAGKRLQAEVYRDTLRWSWVWRRILAWLRGR